MWTPTSRERYKDDGCCYLSNLTDDEWETIVPLLSAYTTLKADLRKMVSACLYLSRAALLALL